MTSVYLLLDLIGFEGLQQLIIKQLEVAPLL